MPPLTQGYKRRKPAAIPNIKISKIGFQVMNLWVQGGNTCSSQVRAHSILGAVSCIGNLIVSDAMVLKSFSTAAAAKFAVHLPTESKGLSGYNN